MTFKWIATFAAACALACTLSGCGFRGGIPAGPTQAVDAGTREVTIAESPIAAPPIPVDKDAARERIVYQLATPEDCNGGPHCPKPAASYAGSLSGIVDAQGNVRLIDPAGLP